MTDVEAAEKLLKQAKLEEKIARQFKKLAQLKEAYEGKCFGTHTFERRNASMGLGAVYYEQFFMKDEEIHVIEWSIQANRYQSLDRRNKTITSFNRTIYDKALTGPSHPNNPYYYLSAGINKPISKDKFMILWEGAKEIVIGVEESFYKNLPECKIESLRVDNEITMATVLLKTGIEVIDLSKFPKVQDCLKCAEIPFFEQHRWLPKVYALPLLEAHIAKLNSENYLFGAQSSRNELDIIILREFIKNNL